MSTRTIALETAAVQELKVSFVPATFDATARTVRVTLYSRGFSRLTRNPRDPWGDPVEETFSLELEHMRTDRMKLGVPLLAAHLGWVPELAASDPLKALEAVIGKIEDIEITEAGIEGVLRFSQRPAVQWVIQDVQDGILDAVSMGARTFKALIEEREGQPDLWTWVDWELCEGSLTPIQADPHARTQSARPEDLSPTAKPKEPPMPEPTTTTTTTENQDAANQARFATEVSREAKKLAAERSANVKEARSMCSTLGLDPDKVEEVVHKHDSYDAAKLEILKMAASKQADSGAATLSNAHRAEVGAEAYEKQVALLTAGMTLHLLGQEPREAKDLLEGLGLKPDDREVKRASTMSLMDIGETLLESRGGDLRQLRGLNRLERAKVLMGAVELPSTRRLAGTDDLPKLVGAALRTYTKQRFVERRSEWKRCAKKVNLPDFEAVKALGGGNFPALLPVTENGTYLRGGVTESEYSVQLEKAGRIFPVSWELMLADRWGRIMQLADDRVTACLRYEDRVFASTIVANKMADGTTDIFSVGNANIAAATGTPSTTTLKSGSKAMARQKGEPGKAGEPDVLGEYLKLAPRYWILGVDDFTDADQLLSPGYVPTTASGSPTERMRSIRNGLIEEPFLDDQSPVYSILVADPNDIVCFQYGYLDGADGPLLEEEKGFTTDGKDYKVSLPFYFGVVEHRGLVKITRS